MRTPGRPKSPTIHPRTKPEAEDYAYKNRQTNDWFRHDGKNAELDPKPRPKTGFNKLAVEIAEKGRGSAADWFEHTSKPVKENVPVRCPTQSARGNHDKIYGRDEPWYKHDENRYYNMPLAKPRLTEKAGFEIKEKHTSGESMAWYKGKDKIADPIVERNGPLPYAKENKVKLHPAEKADWYEHHSEIIDDPNKPNPRIKTAEADEYYQRNKNGNASEWFGHTTVADEEPMVCGYRVGSAAGMELAEQQSKLSDKWFTHEDSADYEGPELHVRCATRSAREIHQNSQGQKMKLLFNQAENNDYSSPRRGVRSNKYGAEDFARKSVAGLVNKILNQAENQGYETNRPVARVKPEAQEIAQKHKGNVNDCFTGYPNPPLQKPRARAPPPEKEGTGALDMSRLIVEYGKLPLSDRKQARVKPEAAEYADRNRGTVHQTLDNYGKHPPDNQPMPRLKSENAQEYALRNRGTMGGIQ